MTGFGAGAGAGAGVTSLSLEAASGVELTSFAGAAGTVEAAGAELFGFAAGFGAGAGGASGAGAGSVAGAVLTVSAGGVVVSGCSAGFGAHALSAKTNKRNKVSFQARITVFSFRFRKMLEQGRCHSLAEDLLTIESVSLRKCRAGSQAPRG